MPGNPDVIAVTLMFTSISPGHDAVVIFDHGVARATNINTPFELINRLQFGSQTLQASTSGRRRPGFTASPGTVSTVV